MAYSRFDARKVSSFLLLLLLLTSSVAGVLALPLSMRAQEDVTVSITGSFYRQNPSIPQGSGISGPSIYVTVKNEALAGNVEIHMVASAPADVTIGFSRAVFVLEPGQGQQVLVRVDVAETAVPGEYPNGLRVSADVYRDGGGGAVTSASGAQVTSLTVVGESANVGVSTVAPSGQPVVSQIRLFRMVGDTGFEVAYSNTGALQAKVVPGTFTAEAYSVKPGGGKLCDPSTFDLAAGEDKTVTLTVRMVYFEDDFVVSPNYDSETKKLLNVLPAATLTNVYDTIANTEVRLLVIFNRDPLDENTVLGPGFPLPLSQTGVNWSYIPAEGWRNGLYGFRYQLYVDGQLMAETVEQTLKVGGGGVASWLWIIFVILGILGTGGLGALGFFMLKRRQKGEKPAKAEKKRKQEKPTRKAEEPVRKPEPVRPVEPVWKEEPAVEPSPLASVSSLKARMASLGRDQGIGKDVEEEPEIDEEDKPAEESPEVGGKTSSSPPVKTEKDRHTEKPHAGHKPGIFSKVTATGKKEPLKPPGTQGPAPAKPPSDVQINWPPKPVEPPKPPSDIQINWPPKPAEPPKPSGLTEVARQGIESQQRAGVPEEAAPAEEAGAPEGSAEEAPADEALNAPPAGISFAEAARRRMQAQQGGETEDSGAPPKEPET